MLKNNHSYHRVLELNPGHFYFTSMNPNVSGSIPNFRWFFGAYEWLFFDNNKLFLLIALSKKFLWSNLTTNCDIYYFRLTGGICSCWCWCSSTGFPWWWWIECKIGWSSGWYCPPACWLRLTPILFKTKFATISIYF